MAFLQMVFKVRAIDMKTYLLIDLTWVTNTVYRDSDLMLQEMWDIWSGLPTIA
jgi:hypothetical protein